ncbi:cytochrome P450 [Conexibacter sp. SYSU D00693]|uniref:cytochrome P450 n=1 Tax=Conexibacter sp. SYSU D00693 TaxID=2812560 RepID=UPI00196A3D79|nr:cytochrome P450 [Conexibacter sp. SYSU D00693]
MATVPPGPTWPAVVQTLAWWQRPLPFFERARAQYGTRFTIRLLGTPPFVCIADPVEVKEVLTAAPDVLHPGEGARILEPVVGPNSVILLDEDLHLEQRRLMLPAFHGERMARLGDLVTDAVERLVDTWPRDVPAPLHGRLQELTLDVILRGVFGLDSGPRLERLRVLLAQVIELGAAPIALVPALQRDWGPGSPGRRFNRVVGEVDQLLRELVDERRATGGEDRDDVLAMLLSATHEDGSPMTFAEIRDELVTALVAGHETTASQLAWTFERLSRERDVLHRLVASLDAGETDYLDATINESLRHRPVLPNAEPRLTKREVQIGGWTYPEGVVLSPHAYLVHHDPQVYPEPYAFRPERFLERPPGTYTFLPFGGGRRRCLGASFALLEMRVVLRTVLTRCELLPGPGPREIARRRSITLSPRRGATVVLRDRPASPASAAAGAALAEPVPA